MRQKDNKHTVGAGMQQALGYTETQDIPFVFSSNGDGFIFHDKTATDSNLESELSLRFIPFAGCALDQIQSVQRHRRGN